MRVLLKTSIEREFWYIPLAKYLNKYIRLNSERSELLRNDRNTRGDITDKKRLYAIIVLLSVNLFNKITQLQLKHSKRLVWRAQTHFLSCPPLD